MNQSASRKNIPPHTLGLDPDVKVDSTSLGALDNDDLVLCTDGLTTMVPDDMIAETIRIRKDPHAMCALPFTLSLFPVVIKKSHFHVSDLIQKTN